MYLKMAIFVSSSALLTGASAQGSLPKVSSENAGMFVTQFETIDKAAQQEWKTSTAIQTGHEDQVQGSVQTWIQPSNKKKPCKVHASTVVKQGENPWWSKPGNHIYWDGNCSDGHAYGLGREFLEENGELSSWLADYDKDKKEPKYHLVTYYDRQSIQFRASSYPLYANLHYAIQASATDKQIMVSYAVLNTAENRIYRKDAAIGNDVFLRSMVLPNKNSYVVAHNTNPITPFIHQVMNNSKGERTGYSISMQDNGIERKSRQFNHQTPTLKTEVSLPQSFIDHFTDVDAKITTNLNAGDKLIQEAFVAINKYKRRICKGNVRVDFMDSGLYGRICLENGELGVFNELMANLQEQQKQRHEQTRVELTRQKEAIVHQQAAQSEERERARVELTRQQAAQSEARRENANSFAQSVNEFAAGMENLNQRSSQFTRSFMNTNPMPGVQFGNDNSVQTNCVVVSNIVHCRTK